MAVPPSWKDSKPLYLVVGIAIGLVGGILLAVALQPGSNGGGSSTGTSPAVSVYSHSWAVNSGSTVTGSIGSVSVYSHTSAVNSGPTTTTPSVSVRAGSAVYVFVGYVNGEIGGGSVSSIGDTAGDSYHLVASTDGAQNHTEDLYVSAPVPRNTTLSLSATFSGGDTTMGGSVALVDVAGSGTPFVDGFSTQSGTWGGTASVNLSTNHLNDLLLLGVSGMGRGAPYVAAAGETLLDTASNTTGPFEDGTGFGTFMASESGTSALLSATLATPAEWEAIGVGILACSECSPGGSTTTPAVSVLAESAVYVFVGYVNPEIGGGVISSITDTAGDTYALVASTGLALNHTEDLYVAGPASQTATLRVSVTFSGGATTMGGSVAVVDVAGSGVPTVDAVSTHSGVGGTASVAMLTNHSSDFLLLGVSGQWKDSPFAPATGETLLDTGGNTTGPFEDGMGFGTFSASEVGTSAELSASLANPAVWNAIAVGILAVALPAGAGAGSGGPVTLSAGTPLVLATVARVH